MKRFRPLLVLVVAGLLLAACGDDSSSGDDSAASDTTAASDNGYDYGSSSDTTVASDTTTAPVDSGAATVAVADIDGVGEALVDPDGFTLYLFEQDDGTTSACTGSCADVWPALVDADPSGGDGVDASLLAAADGQLVDQVVYNGHLLYTFSGDSAPGDATGIGIPDWYPVDPAGDAIDAS
jgi:predicted lipoprotein with Yx(FWY)xxD motif